MAGPKWKGLSSNHQFSGAKMLVSGRVKCTEIAKFQHIFVFLLLSILVKFEGPWCIFCTEILYPLPPSLTARPWKMMVGRRSGFLLGKRLLFRGEPVKFPGCISRKTLGTLIQLGLKALGWIAGWDHNGMDSPGTSSKVAWVFIKVSRFLIRYLEDHPRTCEWLTTMVIVSPLSRVVGPLPNGLNGL